LVVQISRLCRILIPILLALGLSGCQRRSECEGFTSEDALWLTDDRSPNYRHFEWPGSADSFVFEASDLEHLCTLNHFNADSGQDEVLFGLRGCRVASDQAEDFVPAVELAETTPDHVSYQGVLGVWKRSTGEIAVFQGSTLPNWRWMCGQVEGGGHTANMLPTGRYVYEVGRHRDISGAFRLESEVVVLRSNDDLAYETTDDWEAWVPYDNIHRGGCPGEPYASAGCQTLAGAWGRECPDYPDAEAKQHVGPWARFRELAGLDPEDNTDKWGAPFVYVLLTCRDAHLVGSAEETSTLTRLRFGSSGDSVEALQVALRNAGHSSVPANGQMGPETTMAYIRWQQEQYGGAADGVVTPEEAGRLGFSLVEK
jgi:hypothetical protein